MKFKTETITFNDIQPVWEKQLWPNRQSPIKPMSSMSVSYTHLTLPTKRIV